MEKIVELKAKVFDVMAEIERLTQAKQQLLQMIQEELKKEEKKDGKQARPNKK